MPSRGSSPVQTVACRRESRRAGCRPQKPIALGHRRIGFAVAAVLVDVGLGHSAEGVFGVDLGGALIALRLLRRVGTLGQRKPRLLTRFAGILQAQIGIGPQRKFLLDAGPITEFQLPQLPPAGVTIR